MALQTTPSIAGWKAKIDYFAPLRYKTSSTRQKRKISCLTFKLLIYSLGIEWRFRFLGSGKLFARLRSDFVYQQTNLELRFVLPPPPTLRSKWLFTVEQWNLWFNARNKNSRTTWTIMQSIAHKDDALHDKATLLTHFLSREFLSVKVQAELKLQIVRRVPEATISPRPVARFTPLRHTIKTNKELGFIHIGASDSID